MATTRDIPDSKVALAFAKAVLAFQSRAEKARRPKQLPQATHRRLSSKEMENGTPSSSPGKKPAGREPNPARTTDRRMRRVFYLRMTQSFATAGLALAVGILQIRVLASYENSKAVPDAWPEKPSLLSTLMPIAVSVAALVFDAAAVVAYFLGKKKRNHGAAARKALHVAKNAHWAGVAAKTVAYTLVSAVCKAGSERGKSTGATDDLWSWTCSGKSMYPDLISAESNCQSQQAAWIITTGNAIIEVIGVVIQLLALRQPEAPTAEDQTPLTEEDDEAYVELERMDTEVRGLLEPAGTESSDQQGK